MQDLLLEADKNSISNKDQQALVINQTIVAEHKRNHHGRQRLPEHLKCVEHSLYIAADELIGCLWEVKMVVIRQQFL